MLPAQMPGSAPSSALLDVSRSEEPQAKAWIYHLSRLEEIPDELPAEDDVDEIVGHSVFHSIPAEVEPGLFDPAAVDFESLLEVFVGGFGRGPQRGLHIAAIGVRAQFGNPPAEWVTILRTGAVELIVPHRPKERRPVSGHSLTENLLRTGKLTKLLREKWGLEGTVEIRGTLQNDGDLEVLVPARGSSTRRSVQSPVRLSGTWDDGGESLSSELRGVADHLWQGFGQLRCPYYDDEGNWTG